MDCFSILLKNLCQMLKLHLALNLKAYNTLDTVCLSKHLIFNINNTVIKAVHG